MTNVDIIIYNANNVKIIHYIWITSLVFIKIFVASNKKLACQVSLNLSWRGTDLTQPLHKDKQHMSQIYFIFTVHVFLTVTQTELNKHLRHLLCI